MRLKSAAKILFASAFGAYALWGAFVPQATWLLDGANLLFREAGHPFFFLFGQTIGFAGGTLAQLLIPGGLAAAFFYQRQFYSASIMLLWFGQNFFGISVYMRDARSQNLPLVGGGKHDWNYLLHRAGLLECEQGVANIVWVCGVMIVAFAAGFCIYQATRNGDVSQRAESNQWQ